MQRLNVGIALVVLGGDAEVDQDCLTVQPDCNIVWLDVLVDNADDLVAIMHCLEHVDEVIACLPDWNALPIFLVMRVQDAYDVAEAAVGVVFGD